MSQEHLVLEVKNSGKTIAVFSGFFQVPQQENAECEYEAEGVTNYYQCNTVVTTEFSEEKKHHFHLKVTAESICEPRGSVYMTFLLLVPFFILLFAYI